MPVHSFAAHISGLSPHTENYEDVLYEAGCDDALVVVIDQKIKLDFDREASSYDEAVATAIRDIERAGAWVVNVEPLAA